MHDSASILVRMVAVAIGVGILAQVVAGRARLPSIVFLLAFGVLVGPDVLGWIEPDAFGIGLQAIVTVAVALILFEGGLELSQLAFGGPFKVRDWNRFLEQDAVRQVVLSLGETPPAKPLWELDLPEGVLPVLTLRGDRSYICHDGTLWNPGDRVVVLVTPEGEDGLGTAFGAALEEQLDPPATAPAY